MFLATELRNIRSAIVRDVCGRETEQSSALSNGFLLHLKSHIERSVIDSFYRISSG